MITSILLIHTHASMNSNKILKMSSGPGGEGGRWGGGWRGGGGRRGGWEGMTTKSIPRGWKERLYDRKPSPIKDRTAIYQALSEKTKAAKWMGAK